MNSEHPILLYDGVCNYCNAVCNFITRRGPAKRFRFAHLQSPLAQQLLTSHGLPANMLDSVVLIEDGRAYLKSDVTIRIAPHLTGPAKLAVLLRLLPRSLRDLGYDVVARNRYRWWGKQNACIVPTPAIRDRFLDLPSN